MPQPRITRSQLPAKTPNGNGAPAADVTPEEAAAIRSSVAGKEQAPSSRVQAVFESWRKVADQLGDPFEVEKIPISKLRQMRRDPMLGFGLSFIKTPHMNAKWYINAKSNTGPNAQVAAHLDHDLRRIYASFVLQWMNSLDFGFQALAKRFEFRVPSGTYIEISDSGEQTEQPIWSEGGIQPIAWKPFVALRPEGVEPIWNNLGEFDGIEYAPQGASSGGTSGAGNAGSSAGSGGGKGGTNKEETFKIDLYHALWVTNEKDQNFGSIFGFPRLGYAYRYWWSYWFRWAIADRAFERKADPSVIIYHPDGEFVNADTGERLSHAEYALMMGERMRSGGVIALPSEVYEDSNGRGTVRQWEIDFTKESVNFEPFDNSFDYLDIQKLRSLWIPEQAFLEGKGGTSSRNVAAEMGDAFIQSQKTLNMQMVDTINRYMIPQWLAVNYPEFVADNGSAEIVMQGFADEDVEFMRRLIELVGQQESGAAEIAKLVDLEKILRDRGAPIVSFAEQQRREEEAAAAAQAVAQPTPTGDIPVGGTGVVPTATGFHYIANRGETIYLADSGTDFIETLPSTQHYEDKAIKGFSRQLWTLWHDLYADEYEQAIKALSEAETVTASDDFVSLASDDYQERARRLIASWADSAPRLFSKTYSASKDIMGSVMRRAARIELRKINSKASANSEDLEGWLDEHLAEIAAKAAQTTRNEVAQFVARQIEDGADPSELSKLAREHFADFPKWKADRLVRTEVRDIYNAATLLAAQSAGFKRVQAIDALYGVTDADCEARDGKIFAVRTALREREHPNGTLAWRMVPTELTIRETEDIEGAEFDPEQNVVTLAKDLPEATRNKVLRKVVDRMVAA